MGRVEAQKGRQQGAVVSNDWSFSSQEEDPSTLLHPCWSDPGSPWLCDGCIDAVLRLRASGEMGGEVAARPRDCFN